MKTFFDFIKNNISCDSVRKKCFVNVNIPEKRLPIINLYGQSVNYNLIANSSHLISILRPIFGDLNLKHSFSELDIFNDDIGEFHSISSNGHLVRISIHLEEFSNTSVYVKGDKNSFELKPIEKSYLIDGMEINLSKDLIPL